MKQRWNVYLSGEIHTDWRKRIEVGAQALTLPVDFLSPNTDHGSSDDCGVVLLGEEDKPFWKDHKGGRRRPGGGRDARTGGAAAELRDHRATGVTPRGRRKNGTPWLSGVPVVAFFQPTASPPLAGG